MLQFSFPVGTWFGVHVRVHLSLLLLLVLATGYSAIATGGPLRGFALWGALVFALLVRELTRSIAASYMGLTIRGLFFLPVGGVMALSPRPGGIPVETTRTITLIGSIGNVLVALCLVGFGYGVDPGVHLVEQPWIGIEHVLRSAVWLQLIIGIVNLLPTSALPTRRLLGTPTKINSATEQVAQQVRKRAAFGIGTAFALALVVSGVIFGLLWPVLLGVTILFTSYLNKANRTVSSEALSATVREAMLTDYRPLSASSTLRDALRITDRTTQEFFPVLRGERLVGWISRNTLLLKLRTEGNGFLQGAMFRSFQTVGADEKIGDALRRTTALGSKDFIPVIEGKAMVGVLTPLSVERATSQFRLAQAQPERDLP